MYSVYGPYKCANKENIHLGIIMLAKSESSYEKKKTQQGLEQ